ncbi:hypothetical protein HY734_02335 [Candidatus Uhrbacteria bacterium]|nr:hypothetical protein [Candidatus Uhrbacteria bacterium]
MNQKDIIALLERVKDAPELGGGFGRPEIEAHWIQLAKRLGFSHRTLRPAALSWRDYVSYFSSTFAYGLLRPMSVGISAFLLAFTGWVATVNASFASVPGDFLYPVKLATERVQLLPWLSSDEQRMRLHAEFASRRLEEVMEIAGSERSGKEVRVREAVESFKHEIASISAELETVTTNRPETVVQMARDVDRKVGEYTAVLDQSQTDPSLDAHRQQVEEVRTIVEDAKQQITETFVSNHETAEEEQTTRYLQSAFQQDLADIRQRISQSEDRLQAVERVLSARPALDAEGAPYHSDIENVRHILVGFDGPLRETMDAFAAGGFRLVLDTVNALKADLNEVEHTIASMEIDLTTKIQEEDRVESAVSPEVGESTAESQNGSVSADSVP